MGLRLLHFSDIHFYYHSDSRWDRDSDIQNEILLDLIRIIQEQETPIDQILICGDIAFSGKEEEYNIAHTWIKKICETVKCNPYDVFLVPGNHDIDRQVIEKSPACDSLRDTLRKCDIQHYHNNLKNSWSDEKSREILSNPFKQYYSFAEQFNIDIDFIYCTKELKIDENYTLKIRGINSALLSYNPQFKEDPDHDKNNLFVGEVQAQIPTEPYVIHLTMCHHPISWLKDGDIINNMLNSRALIQLYGHEHNFQVEYANNRLKVYSGAMQPSRNEPSPESVYNIIDLSIEDEKLNVEINSRIWSRHSRTFGEYERKKYSLDILEGNLSIPFQNVSTLPQINETEVCYKYHNLNSPIDKINIGIELGVVEAKDTSLPLRERINIIYKRLKTEKRLHELKNLIESKYDSK